MRYEVDLENEGVVVLFNSTLFELCQRVFMK